MAEIIFKHVTHQGMGMPLIRLGGDAVRLSERLRSQLLLWCEQRTHGPPFILHVLPIATRESSLVAEKPHMPQIPGFKLNLQAAI